MPAQDVRLLSVTITLGQQRPFVEIFADSNPATSPISVSDFSRSGSNRNLVNLVDEMCDAIKAAYRDRSDAISINVRNSRVVR